MIDALLAAKKHEITILSRTVRGQVEIYVYFTDHKTDECPEVFVHGR